MIECRKEVKGWLSTSPKNRDKWVSHNLTAFPNREIESRKCGEERAAPSHRPSVKHVEATTETHVDVDNYIFIPQEIVHLPLEIWKAWSMGSLLSLKYKNNA